MRREKIPPLHELQACDAPNPPTDEIVAVSSEFPADPAVALRPCEDESSPEAGVPSAEVADAEASAFASNLETLEPDWNALVARVFAGEREKDVAADAGAKPARLRGKVAAAQRLLKRKDAAEAAEKAAARAVRGPKAAPLEPPAISKAKTIPLRDPAGAWLPAEDITVLRGIGQGRSSFAVSQKLKGRSAAEVADRFAALVPRSSAVAVEAVLREAKARHDAARGETQ